MSVRTLVGFAIWPAVFLTAFAVCSRLLQARPLMTLVLPEPSVASFSPDGTLLMTQPMLAEAEHLGGPIRFWNVPSAQEEKPALRQPHETLVASFLPDPQRFLVRHLSQDRTRWHLKFVDLMSGAEWLHLESAEPCSGCLSGDGHKLACFVTTGREAHAEIWDVPKRGCEASLALGCPVAMSQDGRLLLAYSGTTDLESALVLWDIAASHELGAHRCRPRRK